MLFNSYEFIFLFLPLALFTYFIFNRISIFILIFFSLVFYGYSNFLYLYLILFTIFFNYFLARKILLETIPKKKKIFYFGVFINLIILCYYKYTNFFIDNINYFFSTNFSNQNILLPLAISFFTFQQIAFLSDALKNKVGNLSFFKFFIFIIFFPQLIAGPIVRYNKIVPQFFKKKSNKFRYANFFLGFGLFVLGLSKKVLLADNLAPYVDTIFLFSSEGNYISSLDCILSSIAYSLQLYFDFSGYCDMAMGLAKMFNINLPLNFNSPYKANNIIDFWRRWHITLTKFLTEFIFLALNLSLSRKFNSSKFRFINSNSNIVLYFSLGITFFVSGVWHGAGWNFIFWGFLHGGFLSVNYFWISIKKSLGLKYLDKSLLYKIFSRTFTFFCVTLSFIFFRAENFSSAINILSNFLLNFNDILIISNSIIINYEKNLYFTSLLIGALFIVNITPNSQELIFSLAPRMNLYKKEIASYDYTIRKNYKKIILLCIMISLFYVNLSQLINIKEYIYFRF